MRRVSRATLLTALQPWREVDQTIHRRLAALVDPRSEQEVLWIGCGSGRSVLWWAARLGAQVHGLDPDSGAIEHAEAAARAAGLSGRVTLQVGEAADLPHEAQTFDIVVAHMLYLPGADGTRVVREAARVVRPRGTVAAVVPTWLSRPGDRDARAMEALGVRPLLLVEWKQLFRDAALVELTVEDAAMDGGWLAHRWPRVVHRAWRAGGWAAVRAAVSRPVFALKRLAQSRVLGLSIVKGTRWPHM